MNVSSTVLGSGGTAVNKVRKIPDALLSDSLVGEADLTST